MYQDVILSEHGAPNKTFMMFPRIRYSNQKAYHNILLKNIG